MTKRATPTDAGQDVGRYGYQQELHRSLSFGDLLVYGLVFMVPIAPFGIFGGVFQGSGGMVALAYAIGMVAMMFTARPTRRCRRPSRWPARCTPTPVAASPRRWASCPAG